MKISMPSKMLRDLRMHLSQLKKETTMTYQLREDVAKDMVIPRSVKEDCVIIILTLRMNTKKKSHVYPKK